MRILVVALLVSLILAGCATTQDSDPEANATATQAAIIPPGNDDGSQPALASDMGHMPHLHDYWKNRERVTLFDGEVSPSAVDVFETLFTVGIEKQAKAGSAFFFLPEGALVYEGAGELVITATWTDPQITSLGVSYQSAESHEWKSSQALTTATPLVIALTPQMTDMPHSKTSRWAFEFEPAESPGVAMAPFQLKVEIVKVGDVTLFPAHPRLFDGLNEKILNDETHSFSEVSYAKRATQIASSGTFQEKEVTPEFIVPMETKWVRFDVYITKADASPGQVSDIRFFYHGANRSQLGHPTILPTEGSLSTKHLVYHVEVAMEETDSPYTNESQWRVFVEPATKFSGDEREPDCGGCTDVSIEYRLVMTAYDHALDTAPSKLEGEN